MSIALEDLVGLNRTLVHDLPIVDARETAERLLAHASKEQPLCLAGMRHSQGGHTMVEHGRVLQTAMLNTTIDVDEAARTVTVDAGVTWSELHRVLAPKGLCPRVHQSSPHFTVGGSISVNCHGRDPHAGPISTTVRQLRVLCGDGKERTAKPGDDLFRAVVGGYGSCGLILDATLDLMEDRVLEQRAVRLGSITALKYRLHELAEESAKEETRTHLFYAWLNCSNNQVFWDNALAVSYVPVQRDASRLLKEDAWAESELLHAAWTTARQSTIARGYVWDLLCTDFLRPKPPEYRMNWMRAAVSFTGHHDPRSSDLLLEYFVPLDDFLEVSLGEIRERLRKPGPGTLNILSTTVRLVREDTAAPYLAYCANQPRVCIAIDATVAVDPNAQGRPAPVRAARDAVNAATQRVLERGGSYYMPYYRFAGPDLFWFGYGLNLAHQRTAIETYNPQHRYWNAFLAEYLA